MQRASLRGMTAAFDRSPGVTGDPVRPAAGSRNCGTEKARVGPLVGLVSFWEYFGLVFAEVTHRTRCVVRPKPHTP